MCQPRTRRRRHANSNARLQNPISGSDNAKPRIDDGPVERMYDGADHPCRGPTRKLRIGVQRNDVPDLVHQMLRPRLDGKAIEVMPQKPIEIEQLSPPSLPAHPY